jgi:hypothetical protein
MIRFRDLAAFASITLETGTFARVSARKVLGANHRALIVGTGDIVAAFHLDLVSTPWNSSRHSHRAADKRRILSLPTLGCCEDVPAVKDYTKVFQSNVALWLTWIATAKRAGMITSLLDSGAWL